MGVKACINMTWDLVELYEKKGQDAIEKEVKRILDPDDIILMVGTAEGIDFKNPGKGYDAIHKVLRNEMYRRADKGLLCDEYDYEWVRLERQKESERKE